MSLFERVIIVDWSGGNDRGAAPKKDAIWACAAGEEPIYFRNRQLCESWLVQELERAEGRVFIGFDFPFGYPRGFARAVTGQDDPMALWDWFEARVEDGPKANNRFDLAGALNMRFPGLGPFWGNGLKREIAHLPRKGRARASHGMPERRACEDRAKGAFSCWQMSGAGSVGGQIMMGLPVLALLRRRFGAAAWPMEPWRGAQAVLVEVWPSLIAGAVAEAQRDGEIKDAAQVRVLADAIAALPDAALSAMLDVNAPEAAEEGWIFGLGWEADLAKANETLKPPPLRDDCFALPAGVDWTPVDAALSDLRARLHPVVGAEHVTLAEALGRVLAEDVIAKRANPPAPNAAVDGYGFAFEALGEGEAFTLPLMAGRAAAGVPLGKNVPFGSAVRILTGAALPNGVDTVILEEDVNASAEAVAFRRGIKPRANTRRAGEDVMAGDVILPKGRRVTPADLALAAAVGHGDLPVFERLRVGVLSTGDELVEPGGTAGEGQIFDANRVMLLGLVREMGFEPVDLGRAPDARAELRVMLDAAAERADVILTSGGASAGDEDHMSALLREAGAMSEWRIAIKPGRPLALGMWRGKPVFGLPGNPVAALVCTLVFARPAMGVLAGRGWSEPQGFELPAAFEKRKKPGRREFLRARMRDGRAEVFASEGSGRISGLSWAEGLVELPDGAAEITQGTPVRFIPYASFL